MSDKKQLLRNLSGLKKALTSVRAQELLAELKKEIEGLPSETKAQKSFDLVLPAEIEKDASSFALFSDGACRGNPGPGAWGMLGQDGQGVVLFEASGVDLVTTNNRMELMGAIESLRALEQYLKTEKKSLSIGVYLYSDSRYVLDGLSSWIAGWKARGWKKADKKAPENLDLWIELDEISSKFSALKTIWVKGHSGHPQNERCDLLANQALDEAGYFSK